MLTAAQNCPALCSAQVQASSIVPKDENCSRWHFSTDYNISPFSVINYLKSCLQPGSVIAAFHVNSAIK